MSNNPNSIPPSHSTFTRAQIRSLDSIAINKYHIPGIVLMENAARGLLLQSLKILNWPDTQTAPHNVLLIAGPGNNAGDAFALARMFHNSNITPTIILLRPPDSYSGDALTNLKICQAMQLNIIDAHSDPIPTLTNLTKSTSFSLIIDAIFGTGLTSPPKEPFHSVINWLNDNNWAPILSVDIPSGLDCDTGAPYSVAVKAHTTVTFVAPKIGFTKPHAPQYLGQLIVTDIGTPKELNNQLSKDTTVPPL